MKRNKLDREHLIKKFTKPSMGYAFCRAIIVKPCHRMYYRRYHILHKERIPEKGPVIFVMNHQNALMDAMVIVCGQKRQAVFVARADIFKKPLIRSILFFLRILPIFRKRDGGNSQEENQDTFEVVYKILDSGTPFAMMPEGNHGAFRRLRMLQKGVFRIAMEAQKEHAQQPWIKIMPVGIHYQNTNKYYKDLTVQFGQPIDVSEYYALYLENPAKAFSVLQDVLTDAMKSNMINIESEAFYDGIDKARNLFGREVTGAMGLSPKKAEDRLQGEQRMVNRLSAMEATDLPALQAICHDVETFSALLKKLRLHQKTFREQPACLGILFFQILWMLVLSPVWLFGAAIRFIPYTLAEKSTKTIKDKQFISSVRYVVGMLAYAVFNLLLVICSLIFIKNTVYCLIAIGLIIISGRIALHLNELAKNVIGHIRFGYLQMRKNKNLSTALTLRKKIIEKLTNLVQA